MTIKEKIRNTIIGTVVLANSLFAGGSMELTIGPNYSTYFAVIKGKFGNRLSYLNKNKLTVDYENNVSPFSLAFLSYDIGKGFSAAVEGQATLGTGVVPRVGATYSLKKGGFSLFVKPVANLDDVIVDVIPSYRHNITNKTDLVVNSHNIVKAMYNEGFNFGLSMNRLGIEKNGYTVGVSLDGKVNNKRNVKVNNKKKTEYNPGVFFQKKF